MSRNDSPEEIVFTANEARIMLMWSEQTLRGGHWGDGDVLFPDEARALEKINDIAHGGRPRISARDIEIILNWMSAHCGGNTLTGHLSLNHEESQLREKLTRLKESD